MPIHLPAAEKLIKKYEGLKLGSYRCPAGVLTVGWGHTKDVEDDTYITEGIAQILIEYDIGEASCAVDRNVNVPLNKNQHQALVSFVFNLGEGNFKSSTLLKKINAGDYDAAPSELMRWVNSNGKKLAGLEARRKEEAELWNTPPNAKKG